MLKAPEIGSRGDYEATMRAVRGGVLGAAVGIAAAAAVATIVFLAVGPKSETESGQPWGTVGGSELVPDVLRGVSPPGLLVVPFFALANGAPYPGPPWLPLFQSIALWSFGIILLIVVVMGVVGGFRYLWGGERFKTPRFYRFMICANIVLGIVALLVLISVWIQDYYF